MAQVFTNGAKSLLPPAAPEDIARLAEVEAVANDLLDKQDLIVETGSDKVLTAPATPGGQPGTVAKSSLYGQQFVVFPDYDASYSIGTLTLPETGAANSDWESNTITAAQSGFIALVGRAAVSGGAVSRGMIQINGTTVWSSDVDGVTWVDYSKGPFPVSAGDTARILIRSSSGSPSWTNRAVACDFIPPKVVAMQTPPALANSLLTMGPPDYSRMTIAADVQTPIINGELLWTADEDCYVDALFNVSGAPGSIYISVQPPGAAVKEIFAGGEKSAGERFVYSLKVVKGTKFFTGGDSAARLTGIMLRRYPPVVNPPLYVDGSTMGDFFRKDERVQLANGKILQGTSMLDASDVNIASVNKDGGMIGPAPYEVDEVRIGSLNSHLHMATGTHPLYGEHITYETPSGRRVIPNRTDFNAEHSYYIDSNYNNIVEPNGSVVYPFKTWGDAKQAWVTAGSPSGTEFIIVAGSDLTAEAIDLTGLDDCVLTAPGLADLQITKVGAINIGQSQNVGVKGLQIYGAVTMAARQGWVVFEKCTFFGPVVSAPSQQNMLVRTFDGCVFLNDLTVTGNGFVYVFLNGSLSRANANGEWSAVIVNNPNARVFVLNGFDLSLKIQQASQLFIMNTSFCLSASNPTYAIDVEDGCTGQITIESGNCRDSLTGSLLPVRMGVDCSFSIGTLEFDRLPSSLLGAFHTSGVGSVQVRDNDSRTGYAPFVSGSDTYGQRSLPNTVKDHLNGIAAQLAAQSGITAADRGLKFTGAVDPVTHTPVGGWELGLTNQSAAGSIIIKDKTGADWLNFDVASLASAGIESVSEVTFDDRYWRPRLVYAVGETVNYVDRRYECILETAAADAAPPDADTTHFKVMDNAIPALGTPIDPYETMGVYAEGRVWFCKAQGRTVTQPMIDDAAAKTDGAPYTSDGADFFCVSPGLPVTTPGVFLMFALTGGGITWADMSGFNLSGTQTITVASRQISVRISPASKLVSAVSGLDFEPGYQAYPDADKNKLAALPANADLAAALNAKVDKAAGMALSANNFTDAEKLKLGALPEAADLAAQYVQTGGTNQAIGGVKTFSHAPVVPSADTLPGNPSDTKPATEKQVDWARNWNNLTNKPILLVNDRRLVQITKSSGADGEYNFTAAVIGDATFIKLVHKSAVTTELSAEVTIPINALNTAESRWHMPVMQIDPDNVSSMFAYMTIKAQKLANGDIHFWTDNSTITRKAPGAAAWATASLGGDWITHFYCDKTTSGAQTTDIPRPTASNTFLRSAGANAPEWTATVPANMGGTGRNTLTANALLTGAGTGAVGMLSVGTAKYILQSNGKSAPSWVINNAGTVWDTLNVSDQQTYHKLAVSIPSWQYRNVFRTHISLIHAQGFIDGDLVLYGGHDATSSRTISYAALLNKGNAAAIPAMRIAFTSAGDLYLHINSSAQGSGWHNLAKYAVIASAGGVWYAADASEGIITAPTGVTWVNVTV